MKKWLFDTDVLIDYLRGLAPAVNFLEAKFEKVDAYISVITIAELYAGVKEGQERQILENFLNIFEVVTLNQDIACIGGIYRRDYVKSHQVGLADALIAASSKYLDATLISLNKKHFPMLKNILVPYKK